MITQALLSKLDRRYGLGMSRLILYSDFSGHIQMRDGGRWIDGFAFEDLDGLQVYLSSPLVTGE